MICVFVKWYGCEYPQSGVQFYPPVIIRGKNGKNSENPVGSNKSEKRKPKSAVYRSFWASVVYFHLRLISTKSHKREMTRNQVVGQPARGFESHRLRFLLFSIQKKSCQAGLFLFSKITVDSGQKSVCQNFHGGCGMIGSFVAQLNIYTGYGGVRSLRQIHGHGTAGKDFYAGRP